MPTKRIKRAHSPHRFNPKIMYNIAEGAIGIELQMLLRLGPREGFEVCGPLCQMALAMPREELERFLAAGADFPENFKLRDRHLDTLARWCGQARHGSHLAPHELAQPEHWP